MSGGAEDNGKRVELFLSELLFSHNSATRRVLIQNELACTFRITYV